MSTVSGTAAVAEGKLEPMGAAQSTQQTQLTGQWLFDNFVVSSDEQITKMTVVRNAITAIDTASFKKVTNEMVDCAKAVDKLNGVPEKGPDGKQFRGPKTQSAMNARTILQQAFGALKFAKPQLDAVGYTERTGYQDMRVLAKRALVSAGINWQGVKDLSDAEKDKRRMAKEQKVEKDILTEIMVATPRNHGENLLAYNTRIAGLAEARISQAVLDAKVHKVKAALDKLVGTLDEEDLITLGFALFDHLHIEPAAPTVEQVALVQAVVTADEEQAVEEEQHA